MKPIKLTLTEQQATDMYVALRIAIWTTGRGSRDPAEIAENDRFRAEVHALAALVMDAKVEAARSPWSTKGKSAAERALQRAKKAAR